MKKQLLTILLFLFVTSVANSQDLATSAPEAGSKKFLDYKNGFKDIKLGSDIADLSDKVKLVDKEQNFYEFLEIADLKIGTSKINSIALATYNGKIKDIFISLEKGSGNTIFSVLREAYGIYSDRPNQFMDKYYWLGNKVRLILDFSSIYKHPTVMFSDKKLTDDAYEASKQADKKAINDL